MTNISEATLEIAGNSDLRQIDLGLYSLGNLICYVPLYMMTKMSAEGLFASLHGVKLTSFEIMPLYVLGNVLVTSTFLFSSGWISLIDRFNFAGLSLPKIHWYIAISGLCTVVQVITAIWAYTFNGISLVFVALLMKGGVLVLAPVVDLVIKTRRRKIYWPSWVAGFLSLLALMVSFLEKADTAITFVCAFDIALYLFVYFIKLSIMSRFAKTRDAVERKKYIVEEQIVIAAGLLTIFLIMGLIGSILNGESVFSLVWRGFTIVPQNGFVIEPILIGAAAAGAGIFASFVFLDRRENTFCVAAIQSTSVIAGVIASILLSTIYSQPFPGPNKIAGVAIIICAIVFLSCRGAAERRKICKNPE